MMIASDAKQRVNLPMPFGWFQVLYSHDLSVGQSMPLNYFDTELVAFRTESGKVSVVDAYCPHMGAHLGYGIHENAGGGSRVNGESIVCPFHGWEYNGEGQCTKIPYAKSIPPRIERGEPVLGSWHTREVNQCILVWYHPEGVEPLFEPPVVEEAALGNEQWGELQLHSWDIETHMQEIGENAVDAAHFHYVHGTDEIPEVADSKFDGYQRYGFLKTRNPTPRGVIDGSIENLSIGPGLSVIRFKGICDTVLMANLTPVSSNLARAKYAFLQKKEDMEGGRARIGQALVANICQQMEEDKIIWDRKKFYKRPLLCNGDGPFLQFRSWYKQFLIEPEA